MPDRRRAVPVGRLDVHVDQHPAQRRVLLAGVDLDGEVLDRVGGLLLLLVGELLGQRARSPATPRPRAFSSAVLTSSSSLLTSTPPVILIVSVSPTLASPAFLASVSQRRGSMPSVASDCWSCPARCALLLRLLVAGLELLEDLVGDRVLGPLEVHERLVAGGGDAGLEALAGALEGRVDVELGQLALALRLERAGQLERDRALQLRRASRPATSIFSDRSSLPESTFFSPENVCSSSSSTLGALVGGVAVAAAAGDATADGTATRATREQGRMRGLLRSAQAAGRTVRCRRTCPPEASLALGGWPSCVSVVVLSLPLACSALRPPPARRPRPCSSCGEDGSVRRHAPLARARRRRSPRCARR